jgi:hypothetical protein
MKFATQAVIFSLAVNIFILFPVVSILLLNLSQAETGFGPVTDGRLILTSIYMAIAIVSGGLIAMHLKRLSWAMPMSVALFSVQITYKLITIPMVGLSNPVVITNLLVVAIQVLALSTLWRMHRKVFATT